MNRGERRRSRRERPDRIAEAHEAARWSSFTSNRIRRIEPRDRARLLLIMIAAGAVITLIAVVGGLLIDAFS